MAKRETKGSRIEVVMGPEARRMPRRVRTVFDEHVRALRKERSSAGGEEEELTELQSRAQDLIDRIAEKLGIAEEINELRQVTDAIDALHAGGERDERVTESTGTHDGFARIFDPDLDEEN